MDASDIYDITFYMQWHPYVGVPLQYPRVIHLVRCHCSSTIMTDTLKPSRPPPPFLPDGWIAIWDEQEQRYYYANQVTRTTQWEVPTAPAAPRPPPQGSPIQLPVSQRLGVSQQVPVDQQYQTVIVQQPPVAVPMQTRGRGGAGLATGLLVGSMLGRRRRRRR